MMPIMPGDRGSAVEDIQRRLLTLGYDLGPTGVDGVFLGRTAEAVRAFQASRGLREDASVGDETWSALVDETFTLGDRILYLRLPHFHGRDVHVLQQALSALGFACGSADGIFGTFTERAVAEFQRNAGLVPDGIAGDETTRVLFALRHMWEGKDPRAHSAAIGSTSRAADVLTRIQITIDGLDDCGLSVAGRMVNLALASTPDALIRIAGEPGEPMRGDRSLLLLLSANGTDHAVPGRPMVVLAPPESLTARLMTAIASSGEACPEVLVELGDAFSAGEHDLQRAAVQLLDAVCAAFD